jgi:hypothetical protein
MTSKQRLLSAIKGEKLDFIPWSPNLAYWWEHEEISGSIDLSNEVCFLRDIGADPLIRGHYPISSSKWEDMFLFDTKYKKSTVRESVNGNFKQKIYETPVGNLNFMYRLSDKGNTWFLTEHGVKNEEDFKILQYLKEDTILIANYTRYEEESNKYREDALLVPILCPESKSAFQAMLEYWVGTEELIYALADFPETVIATLGTMRSVSEKAAEISSQSSAEAFLTWEDTSTTNLSPQYYEKYILPEINSWCDILHKNNKLYVQHACGHLKDLMTLIAKSKIDCIESISPPPTGNIELWEAREQLPENIALIGGIEPTVFLNYNMSDLEKYVTRLIEKMKHSKFVIANSDSCPPGVELEKFKLVSEIIKSRGNI